MHWIRTLTRRWAYLLALSPILTDWLETGHLPHHPVEYTTEIVVGLLLVGCIGTIYRDMDRLKIMAETDGLTALYNRRKFMGDIERAVQMAHRLDGALSLVYLDVDEFKRINDRRGHSEGDAVLRHVAALLGGCARRRVDAGYRLGGDEFALLLPGVGAAGATAIVRRACAQDGPAQQALQRLQVSLSFGAVQLHRHEDSRMFLRRADAEMYRNKQGVKNSRLTPGADAREAKRRGARLPASA
ncbi:MAG TPA: GGDEF domain-containing protein [Gammaproteobacteria bacterium]|nr:GGDEF domain-containing protein [Gammaproteobacteria bacterium]